MADYYVDESGIVTVTNKKKKKKTDYVAGADGVVTKVSAKKEDDEEDIAPVKTTKSKAKEEEARKLVADTLKEKKKSDERIDFFQKPEVLDDGYDLGDGFSIVAGTATDAAIGVVRGGVGMLEGVSDFILHRAADVAGIGGENKASSFLRNEANFDTTGSIFDNMQAATDQWSVFGRTTDAIAQGVGQFAVGGAAGNVAGTIMKGGSALVKSVPLILQGISGTGRGESEAYNAGATPGEARAYGAISGFADAASEAIFGGLGKGVDALGFSHGLSSADDMIAKALSKKIQDKTLKNLVEFGVKASAEGLEEVAAGLTQAFGKWITYQSEKDFADIVRDENLLEQAVVGWATSAIAQAPSLHTANKTGTDFITGMTESEQKVVDKEVENRIAEKEANGENVTAKDKQKIEKAVVSDLEKGYISTDTIEETLAGDTYKAYKEAAKSEEATLKEYNELAEIPENELSRNQRKRLDELEGQLEDIRGRTKSKELKTRLNEEISTLANSTRLSESYREAERRGQLFEADLGAYNEKQRTIVQKAIDSGILNNTNRSHEFVDTVAKLYDDKGVSFDFTNNEKLKKSGFALEGVTVNGFITKDGITLNMDSPKVLESTVGHEITHVLEGTELYTELQNSIIEYAKKKGDYQNRYDALTKLYANVEGADINAELTADLVGDYLFTDEAFISNLSANHRNVFQKVYDEIKYLLKVVTAGSKEARQLEQVKRAFDKAYRAPNNAKGDTKTTYSLAMVEDVQPTSEAWHRTLTTDEAKARFPKLWDVAAEESDVRNPTQISTTVKSYRKVYNYLKSEGFDGTILDASSGLGYGTRAGVEEYGFNVEDIEPYPDKSYEPKYKDYSTLDKKYDVIISNAVLNVLPQDQRDALVIKMGEMLNDGGRIFINVRGADVNTLGNTPSNTNISPMEWFVDSTGSYQKGFTKPELVAYLKDALGDGFTVKPTSMFGAVSAIVTKDGGVKYSLSTKSTDSENSTYSIDKYNQKQYNSFGWARDTGAITKNELDDMHSKIYVKGSLKKFPQSSYGEAIIEVNDKPHTTLGANNAIVFVTGTKNDPKITRVVRINLFDEGSLEVIRKDIYEYTDHRALETYASRMGEDILRYYDRDHYADYRAYTEKSRTQRSGSEGEGNTPANRNGDQRSRTFEQTQADEIAPIKEVSSTDDAFFDAKKSAKYSLSTDSDGKQLTNEQSEYFKNSKMRDDNGNLKVMYHGTTRGGFHEFDGMFSDDSTSFFFTDSNDVASSYSGTSETYAARTFRTAEDFNNFFAEIGATEYRVAEETLGGTHKWFILYEGNTEVASAETPKQLYEEFRDWSGLGEGEVNYKVYLNLENPLVVDAGGMEWDRLPSFREDAEQYEYIKVLEVGHNRVKIEYSMRGDTAPTVEDVDLDEKFGDGLANMLANMAPGEILEGDNANPTTTREYAQYAKENGYDGVIFNRIIDIGGYGADYKPATVAIAFESNQVKSVDNTAPTSDPDIRFSLSEAVEETNELMALHNLRSEELLKSLDLGGLPMPSIAVIKAGASHEQYGDVSLILPKETIDPQRSKDNKVYGGDAWTPTYPRIEYKPNEAVADKISDKYYDLANRVGYDEARPLYNYVYDLERALNSEGGEAALLESLYDNTRMMQAYLYDTGKGKVEPVQKETRAELSDAEVEMDDFFIKELGADVVDGVMLDHNSGLSISEHRIQYWQAHGEDIKAAYEKLLSEQFGFSESQIENATLGMNTMSYMKLVRDAYMYRKNGRVTTKTETDYAASEAAIRAAAADGYKEWVDGLFKGIEEKSGIRNNADYFTPSGNPRSWDALHWENTLENVVRVMKQQNQTGADAIFAAHQIFATSAKEYGSIPEIKADSDRLYKMSEEEYEAVKDSYTSRFSDIASRIMDKGERNQFIALDNAMECIVDAVRKSKTKAGITKELKRYGQLTVAEQDVDDIVSLVNDIANMPTGYFEAKPRRAVGFEEVGVFVIPNNADTKLKQELLNRGYSIAEYDPNIEGDRQRVVNSFEEYKFSLSDASEVPYTNGKRGTYGRDVLYAPAVQEDVAPVRETARTEQPPQVASPEDYAPLTEDDGVYMQYLNDKSLAYMTDEDTPPEVEAPHGEGDGMVNDIDNGIPFARGMEEPLVNDPFEERDIDAVGNRKVKAYMYENPEVKPFFQEAATYMLGELENSTKGHRWFNDKLYYDTNGEKGFGGTPRVTSDDIAYLLDVHRYTYADIEKGLRAIIEDNGAENNAISKRIEFALHDRLVNGYADKTAYMDIPPNPDYINLLNEKNITEYSKEAFDALAATDAFVPPMDEDFAPIAETAATAETPMFNAVTTSEAPVMQPETRMPSNPQSNNTPAKVKPTTAQILTEEPKVKNNRRGLWSLTKEYVFDNGMVFEEVAKENKNRELEARWNSIRNAPKMAQHFIENGKNGVKSVNTIRKEVERRGLLKPFQEYMYHMHNIDRMSLESKAQAKARQMLAENPMLAQITAQDTVEDIVAKIESRTSQMNSDEAINPTLGEKNAEMLKNKQAVAADLFEKAQEYSQLLQVENKPVFGDEMTADKSYAAVQELIKAHPELQKYAEDIYENNKMLRNMMVEEGIISPETAQLWQDMYPHYVPVRREGDEGLNVNVPLDTFRTGINAPIKGATGGNRNILPLFDTLGMRAIQTYNAIAKNRFGIELKDTLGTTVEANTATLDDAFASLEQTDSLLTEGKNGMLPTFTVFEGGERVMFEITDEMYDAMKPTGSALSYTNKTLNTASNLFRGLLTEYNPVFIATNAMKDIQDVLINSQHPAKTYASIPRALVQMTSNGKYYREYLENGGEGNTYFEKESNTFKKENKALEVAKTLTGLNAISKANQFVEMIPRLSEYIASREAGRSIDVSMLDAARVTTNFAAGGKLTKFLNRNGATFLGASVNGAVQQVRNIVEAKQNGVKGVLGLAAKFIAAGLPVALLNAFIWDDDEEYEELSDYVKQNYYIVGKFGDGKFVRIPKGRAVAVIQDAFAQMEHLITGDDEADLGAFLELAFSNLAPNNPIDNNIFAPIKQVIDNKTWYGDDLVPQRLQDLPAAEQYDESTDELSRWLGEKLGDIGIDASPYKINYLLNQYTGGLGDVALPMLTPEAESGSNSLVDNLLAPVRSKFTTDSVMNNQNVSDFYDKKNELTTNAKSSKATDDDALMSKYMNSMNAEISELYAQKREIQNSKLSDSEKYAKVREIQSQIVELTKESLATYEDINYDGDYANIGDRYFKRDKDGEWQKLSDEQVTKYKVTSEADGAPYATDGDTHYRWYVKEGEAETDGEWRKLTDEQLEKQEKVTNGLGISPEEYWGNKEEYDYAYESPERYAVSKAVGGYEAFKKYSGELYDIKADKDADGKSISGSRKEKVIEYINNLDADYGEKIILFKSEYTSDDTYNEDIVNYLIGREDIPYEDKVTIFKELGFTVSADGTVYWD